jgi:hypothetical protein
MDNLISYQQSNVKYRNKELNPAMLSALSHAKERSERENSPMFVFIKNTKPFRTWFVRNQEEGKPEKRTFL